MPINDLQSTSAKKFCTAVLSIATEQRRADYAAAIQALETAEGTVRYKAIEKLISKAAAVLDFLVYAIGSDAKNAISAIVWELQKVNRPWAREVFIHALQASDVDVRLWALTELADIDDASAAPAMIDALTQPASETKPSGVDLEKLLLKENHAGVLPLIFVVPYLEKHGDAHIAEALLTLAVSGVRADLSLRALKAILSRHGDQIAKDTLAKIAALKPIANHDFLYDNDDPDDLSTHLTQIGICQTKEISNLAQQELMRR